MKQLRTPGVMALFIFLLVLPVLSGDATLESLAIQTLLLSSAAVAWNIFSGYTGYISLGQATYYGLGAYSFALVSQDVHISGSWSLCLLLPFTGLIAGVFAIPLGWVMLHARRSAFMLISLAIFFVFQQLAYNLRDLTGGSEGIFLPVPDWSSDLPFYFMAMIVLVLLTLVSWGIRGSKFGLTLLAIRDDEERVCGLGVRTRRYKLGAYVLSAGFTGVIGALSIFIGGFINPMVAFDQSANLTVAVVCFFGGIGTVMGPVVGSLLLGPLQAYLQQQIGVGTASLDQILLGCLLLVVLIISPEGVVPSARRRWAQVSTAVRIVWKVHVVRADSSSNPMRSVEPSMQHHAASDDRPESEMLDISYELPQYSPLSTTMGVSRVRAPHLVPLSSPVPSAAHEGVKSTSSISWRCPSCRKPFLLRGNTCYCPRCGITRPVMREEQLRTGESQ